MASVVRYPLEVGEAGKSNGEGNPTRKDTPRLSQTPENAIVSNVGGCALLLNAIQWVTKYHIDGT